MEGIIDNISEKIADIICNDNQEFEIIIYGVHQMITIILNLFLTVISGIIWQNFSFLAVMYFYFSILRPYAGGYHSETEGKCLVISIALINLILFAKRYVRLEIPAFIVICVASMAVIFLWAPIGNPNKTLDMMEKKVYKRKSHIITVMGFLSIITAFIFKWQILYEGIIYGMFLSAALLIAGKIKYRTLLAMEKC